MKRLSLMNEIEFGIMILVNDEHSPNAPDSMIVADGGILIRVNLVHE